MRRVAIIKEYHRQISFIVCAGVPAVVVQQIFQIAVVVHIRRQDCIIGDFGKEHIPADLTRFAFLIALDNLDFLPRLEAGNVQHLRDNFYLNVAHERVIIIVLRINWLKIQQFHLLS